jgi:dTDP-4-dehydrorhamnose reductase
MKIVIIGSGGRLGAALLGAYCDKFEVRGFSHSEIDLGDFDEIEQFITPLEFNLLINSAAMTNVDMCEEQRDEAFRINGGAPDVLAEICEKKNARMIHFSTDYVFDGEKNEPYLEEDEANPISAYGESKREGEEAVLAASDRNLVVRVSWVFGPDRPSFIDNIIQRARENESVAAVADKFSTPTYSRDIAEILPRFFGEEAEGGMLHFANTGECSWQEYTQHALDVCHESGIPLKAQKVDPLKMSDMKSWIARRPVHTVLSTEKYSEIAGTTPRAWRDAVAEYVRDFVARK